MSRILHSITPMDEEGVVRCYTHALMAARKTSKTTKNRDRDYYCCSKSIDDPERCSFFYWVDDPMFRHKQTPSFTSVPTTTDIRPTPPATPRKRPFQPALTSPSSDLTPSQKRTRLIKEALAESSTPSNSNFRTEVSVLSPIRSQPSQKRMRDIQLGLSLSNGISKVSTWTDNPSNSDDIGGPSTLFQREQQRPTSSPRLSAPPHHTNAQLANNTIKDIFDEDEDEDTALWALVTPPSSSQDLGPKSDECGINVGIVSPTFEAARKTVRERPPRRCSDGLTNVTDEQEANFWSKATNNSPGSNSYSRPLDFAGPAVTLSADKISAIIDSLNDIPDYMRKLERRKIAAEKGSNAKTKRIADLEEEVDKLRTQNRALKESLDMLPTSGP